MPDLHQPNQREDLAFFADDLILTGGPMYSFRRLYASDLILYATKNLITLAPTVVKFGAGEAKSAPPPLHPHEVLRTALVSETRCLSEPLYGPLTEALHFLNLYQILS